MATGQSGLGSSLVKVPSSQLTPVCVKLTSTETEVGRMLDKWSLLLLQISEALVIFFLNLWEVKYKGTDERKHYQI